MKTRGILILVLLWTPASLQAEDLGTLSANLFGQDSTSNQFGRCSSPELPNNPYGKGWRIEGGSS